MSNSFLVLCDAPDSMKNKILGVFEFNPPRKSDALEIIFLTGSGASHGTRNELDMSTESPPCGLPTVQNK